jgi:hypothetical protein
MYDPANERFSNLIVDGDVRAPPSTSVPIVTNPDPIVTMRRWLAGEPVWTHAEIISRWGAEFRMYREFMYREYWGSNEYEPRTSIERSIELSDMREKAITEFGFMLPCKELLDALEANQPIVEVGAGTGFMTALMRHRGIDVIGTDIGDVGYCFKTGRYDPSQLRLQAKTAVRRYRDRTVFCSWPTYDHTWMRQALRAMRIGQRAIIIEEDSCAEETAWEYRNRSFEGNGMSIRVPAWNYMNDRAALWIKKRHHVMRVPTAEQTKSEREAQWKRFRDGSALRELTEAEK